MYSAVAGLSAHQTKFDVIGNNIANVNTTGFKSSSARFSDVYYQTISNASGANDTTGTAGKNAMQVGLGSKVSSITASVTSQGAAQSTNNPFDIMINGDSFFIVNQGGTNYFTKAGAFNVDASGYLCNSAGNYVMGWQVDPNDDTKTVANTVTPLQIMSADKQTSEPEATTKATISGNIDMNDTQIAAGGTGKPVTVGFYDEMGNKYTASYTLKQTAGSTSQYTMELTDIYDTNNESIFATKNPTTGAYAAKTAAQMSVTLNGVTYSASAVDATSGKVTLTGAAAGGGAVPVISFDGTTGKFLAVGAAATAAGATSMDMTFTATPNPFKTISMDFSSMTMFANGGKSSIEGKMGDTTGQGAGRKIGEMNGVKIDGSGKIYGTYDNGDQKLLGQIAVASFSNPAGLEAVGGSLFAATQNSGEFDGIGQDPSLGGNSLSTGYLEMSNVDLSAEFTEMITTQRGFQANSRIITTSDSLLEELINLKR
ncbi:flagellar hook protein FlgE [Lachnospiraceae bacterium KM106-2]|nr:flagellar hook protein FlgE [Lachnospiraceae bacterium KM106-2]